ncbi:hypothetical protein PCYB_002150 [Plasmodium cynomolgi strain B]|uniref:CYIR protein n=1 Tax=Plasmodium cynomolgi (strain B) TaxID=1120755 RepID=K6UF46_PLACD|nr:hypothetical protein PCYB_002150 [Plasmodium cynomolgi strain B]GAB69466.1 hypothetical protein PCYB_002150 [Plasmodium cynomolgi strain B]
MLKQNISNLSKVCEYLNYWIYYIIKDSLQCIYNINSLYYVLDRLKLLYIPRRHKILHWIKNEYTVINNSNRAEYNQYLNESYNIYKEIICKDDSTLKENCSKELTKFREIFNEAIASLKGKNISINQADIPLENNTLCTTISPRNETVPELPVGLEAQEGPGESDISVLLDAAGYAPSTDRVTMDQGINVITPEDVRPNKASSWINNKILGENKPMDNMKRNRNELLLNDIGNREMTLNDTMYHIRYNSAANS